MQAEGTLPRESFVSRRAKGCPKELGKRRLQGRSGPGQARLSAGDRSCPKACGAGCGGVDSSRCNQRMSEGPAPGLQRGPAWGPRLTAVKRRLRHKATQGEGASGDVSGSNSAWDSAGEQDRPAELEQQQGHVARFLGGTVAVVLILAVALAVLLLHRRPQKSRLEADSGGMALPSSQKLEPSPDRHSHRAPEDIQILHLEPGKPPRPPEQEELEQLPLQTPYYDLGTSPAYRPPDSHLTDTDIHHAELETSALELESESRTTMPGPGEVVEYATIQLSPP
ncbi:uncharacterized protein LOC123948845 [Meles meles]|uniref:uncharacterized protein LOC123948845 n=1 Tax=Meles meles TaxID=9662 RepID=UPI001E69F3FD|nr:uncharacterized protein LOC123948845 [Meles meles]